VIPERRASLEESDGNFHSKLSNIRTERFDSDLKSFTNGDRSAFLKNSSDQMKNSSETGSSMRQSKGLVEVKNMQSEL
jgi:hypothetical protein